MQSSAIAINYIALSIMIKCYSIGHSTHSISEFINILKAYNIEKLVDIRSHPGSRYVPQFNKEILSIELSKNNIEYVHISDLGGHRSVNRLIDNNSVNGWKNKSFLNYAAYTLTDEYEKGINQLINEAENKVICYMCAEQVPWKCHRLLVSNTLAIKNIIVYHIFDSKKYELHILNKYGAQTQIVEGKVIYPLKK